MICRKRSCQSMHVLLNAESFTSKPSGTGSLLRVIQGYLGMLLSHATPDASDQIRAEPIPSSHVQVDPLEHHRAPSAPGVFCSVLVTLPWSAAPAPLVPGGITVLLRSSRRDPARTPRSSAPPLLMAPLQSKACSLLSKQRLRCRGGSTECR